MSTRTRNLRRINARKNRRSTLCGVYLIEFESGLKLGITKNFNYRFKFYNDPWVQPIYSIWFLRTENYKTIEKELKKQYFLSTLDSCEYFERRKKKEIIESLEYVNSKLFGKSPVVLIYDIEKEINLYSFKIRG